MSADHSFDTIIVGGGAMGGAAAWRLSARGQRVLVLDRFHPPHDLGSTHGETRVIREAYFEHPVYVPLVQHAYELWHELEVESGRRLLQLTGGLMIGNPDGVVFAGARASAEQHGLSHEILEGREVQQRFPALQIPDAMKAVFEPRAGILFVAECVSACLELAAKEGVVIRFDEPVLNWQAGENSVEVRTERRSYSAASLVIAAGSWLPQMVPELAGSLRVERQVLHWFQPSFRAELLQPDRLPVHVIEYEPGKYFYALPDVGSGLKAALHHQGATTSPDDVCRDVSKSEQQSMTELVRRHLPTLQNPPHRSAVCLYTNTPDEHFLIDRHPAHSNVVILSPCSGHGFKFASAVGELAAGLIVQTESPFDLSLFAIDRLNVCW